MQKVYREKLMNQSRCMAALAFLLALWRPAAAQVSTAGVLGRITDRSGAVIAGAEVVVRNVETNFTRTTQSRSNGIYSLNPLPVGTYRIEVSAPGFKKQVRSGVVIDVSLMARVDATLDIGEVSESVAVLADATRVNTTDASLGRTVQNKEVVSLPLVNRDVYALLGLTPGIENSETVNNFGYPEQHTMINGGAYGGSGSVNYYLDGGSNMGGLRNTGNAAPNPDAVQEFRVITNSYSAEFGRYASGVIDVITKSGTNEIHGAVFEFLRNDALNANSYNAITRPPQRRNQFGGSVGAPVRRDRTFAFLSYSGLRQRVQDLRNTAIVPSAAQRGGDFSAVKTAITDPFSSGKTPFAGNQIPVSRFDPAALKVMNRWIPQANLAGNFFQGVEPHPTNSNEGLFKVDHTVNAKHQLAGSYYVNKGEEIEPFVGGAAANIPWVRRQFSWQQQNLNASDTWTINSTMINQVRATYVRNYGGRVATPFESLGDYGSAYRIQGPPSLPQIAVSGYFQMANGITGPVGGGNSYGLREVFSWNRGPHSIKVGGDFSLDKLIQTTNLNNYGVFTFDGSKSGNALADFLLGAARQFNQDAPVNKTDSSWYTGLFVQDDYRIHPRVVLNAGLRWDLQLPYKDPQDRKVAFVAGQRSSVVPTAPVGLLFPGDAGIERGIVGAQVRNFSPRLGFAWDPFGTGRTSIRGAAGIFYGSTSGNEWNTTADRQPFSARQTFSNVKSFSDPYGLLPGGVSPYPYVYDPKAPRFIAPASVNPIDLNFKWPSTYQLNFSVQHEVVKDTTVTAAYVGSMGRHLPFQRDINYPLYGATATSGNVDARRPYLPGTLSIISLLQSSMTNSYNALQVSLDKRFARNFTLKGFYTFSKSLEGAQLQNETTDGSAQDMNNLRLEKARSNLDRRHNFVFSGIWEINYFENLRPVPRYILQGWTVSSIVSFRGGQPFTVTSGRDNNLDGLSTDRPNLIGNPVLDPHRSRNEVTNGWFNAAAFTANLTGQDGNAGRNILDGPGLRNVDVGLFRNFKVTERVTLQLRGELTNALNLVNLLNPTASLNSPAVGTIRTGRPMRQSQLGLRLLF